MRFTPLFLICVFAFANVIPDSHAIAQEQGQATDDAYDPNDPDRVRSRADSYRKALRQQLETAFQQTGNFVELDDDKIKAVKKALKDDIDQLAEARARESRTFVDYQVPVELQARLLEELTALNCDAQKLNAYQKSTEAKAEFLEVVAKESYIRILDDYFILNGEQVRTLEGVQAEHWTPRLTDRSLESEAYSWHNAKELYQDLSQKLPDDFLNPTQVTLLNSHDDFSLISLRSMAAGVRKGIDIDVEEEENAYAKSYREWISHSFDLKIAELEDICELTETQRKKITVIEKGVVGQVIKRREELIEIVVGNMNRRGGGAGGRTSSMDAAIEFARTPSQAIDKCKRWMNTVPKTLDEDQLAKIQKYWQERANRGRRSKIGCGVLSLTKIMPDLDFGRQKQLIEKLLEATLNAETIPSSRSRRSYFTNNELLTLVSDETYQQILTEAQWSKLKPVVGRLKKQQEQAQAAAE